MLLWTRLYQIYISEERTLVIFLDKEACQSKSLRGTDQSFERDLFEFVHHSRIILPRFFIVNTTSTILLRAASDTRVYGAVTQLAPLYLVSRKLYGP